MPESPSLPQPDPWSQRVLSRAEREAARGRALAFQGLLLAGLAALGLAWGARLVSANGPLIGFLFFLSLLPAAAALLALGAALAPYDAGRPRRGSLADRLLALLDGRAEGWPAQLAALLVHRPVDERPTYGDPALARLAASPAPEGREPVGSWLEGWLGEGAAAWLERDPAHLHDALDLWALRAEACARAELLRLGLVLLGLALAGFLGTGLLAYLGWWLLLLPAAVALALLARAWFSSRG